MFSCRPIIYTATGLCKMIMDRQDRNILPTSENNGVKFISYIYLQQWFLLNQNFEREEERRNKFYELSKCKLLLCDDLSIFEKNIFYNWFESIILERYKNKRSNVFCSD